MFNRIVFFSPIENKVDLHNFGLLPKIIEHEDMFLQCSHYAANSMIDTFGFTCGRNLLMIQNEDGLLTI